MVSIVWSVEAARNLERIRAYVAQFDPAASSRLSKRLVDAAQSLEHFPERGRPAAFGCRELVTVPPYVIRYEVVGNQVSILGIRHGAQLADA